MSGRVQDKVAIITGAGTGIGEATMVLFGREGARVVGVSRTQSALDDTLAQTRAAGGDGFVVASDLSTLAGAEKVIAATLEAYGRIDILVHAAGVGWSWGQEQSPGSMQDIANTSPEHWAEVMAINLDSCFYMCRGVIPIMQKQGGGSIVNVASISGFQGMTTAHTYCAGKGAMINLTRAMSATYAMDGIRSNCVCPGYTDTPMISPRDEPVRRQGRRRRAHADATRRHPRGNGLRLSLSRLGRSELLQRRRVADRRRDDRAAISAHERGLALRRRRGRAIPRARRDPCNSS